MKAVQLLKNVTKGIYKKTEKLFDNPFKKVGFSWWKMRVIKNLPNEKLQSVNLFGIPLYFRHRDEVLHSIEEILIDEIYKQNLPDKPYIIDCGANIGLSVIYLKRSFPGSTIIAFEPDEINFDLLEKNIKPYNFDNVFLKKEAVWKENSVISFAGNKNQMSHIEEAGSEDAMSVKAVRLKNYLNKKVDFLKIDIEGAEYEVMKDIAPALGMVNHLFVEYHGTFQQNEELNEILNLITGAGFRYYIRHAIDKHPTPFIPSYTQDYDVQLNIFCFRS
jgi:FkbM family methyltransferase